MLELQMIEAHYGQKVADRSQVPLINHIYDGLAILRHIGASDFAQRAFCLHPMYQHDDALRSRYLQSVPGVPVQVMMLVMEYRHRANSWLSDRVRLINKGSLSQKAVLSGLPTPGGLPEVRHMLIADKVQNYYDFAVYHRTHPRFVELHEYFKQWFIALAINDGVFAQLVDAIVKDRNDRSAERAQA